MFNFTNGRVGGNAHAKRVYYQILQGPDVVEEWSMTFPNLTSVNAYGSRVSVGLIAAFIHAPSRVTARAYVVNGETCYSVDVYGKKEELT